MTGPELVAARERMGLTQDALATLLGVHVDTVSRWERGTRKISTAIERLVAAIEGRGADRIRRPLLGQRNRGET